MVFQWLKDITLGRDFGIGIDDEKKPELPQAWTSLFACLAKVSAVFFHASTEVLWERVGSLEPLFGYVLPTDKDAKGGPMRRLSVADNS